MANPESIEGNNSSSESNVNHNDHVIVEKETLQALLSLIDTNKKPEERRDQQTFVSLREEKWPFYFSAHRHERQKPITALLYKHKKDTTNSNNLEAVHKDEKEEGQEEVPIEEIKYEAPLIDEVKDNYKKAESQNPKEVIKEKLVIKETKGDCLLGPRYYNKSDYVDLLVGWDEEEEYWYQDIQDFPKEKDLITLIDINNKNTQTNFSPILDLLDFYYDDITINHEYHISLVPQNIKDKLEILLQDRQDNFVSNSKNLGRTKSAHFKESLTITQDIIEYEIGEEKERLYLSKISCLSDVQRMRDKLSYFLEDLRRFEFIPQALPEVKGETWKIQVQNLCQMITSSKVDTNTRLGHYYQLGTLLATQNWNDEAQSEIRESFPIENI
ncbi:42670_t:CDS:2 [Gigaspora margarita]|uniref:42670_t:CDS:1 n=1 Tax=Gigaspora margarita TaxID=4874 RepID=A0ABM8W451_GIGMA|nr:42670_t:CDS:2 [Gigaspora margarita]